jgi:glycyl-tRNA synthetase beta chain
MTLAAELATSFGAESAHCRRAAELCKCDLVTEMVGEFPELQGTMGRYYALADGEPAEVATAVESHYRPRHAGDALPDDAAGQALAVADRLDSLVGVFAAGKKPTGGKDPFALRRAALAIVRILDHTRCELAPRELIDRAAEVLGERIEVSSEVRAEVDRFLAERLRSHLAEQGIATNTLRAVTAGSSGSVADFADRARAVQSFADDPAVSSLIAANKRAANLLEQAGGVDLGDVDRSLLQIDAEKDLFEALREARASVDQRLAERDYPAVLEQLAGLRPAVDRFFDDVMVMVDDQPTRENRLALLERLRALFLRMADVALLGRT